MANYLTLQAITLLLFVSTHALAENVTVWIPVPQTTHPLDSDAFPEVSVVGTGTDSEGRSETTYVVEEKYYGLYEAGKPSPVTVTATLVEGASHERYHVTVQETIRDSLASASVLGLSLEASAACTGEFAAASGGCMWEEQVQRALPQSTEVTSTAFSAPLMQTPLTTIALEMHSSEKSEDLSDADSSARISCLGLWPVIVSLGGGAWTNLHY